MNSESPQEDSCRQRLQGMLMCSTVILDEFRIRSLKIKRKRGNRYKRRKREKNYQGPQGVLINYPNLIIGVDIIMTRKYNSFQSNLIILVESNN
jgi:hypothetical protein